jgi:hypothetical protein
MSGTFGEVKARLIAVNRWSEAEFAAYDAEQVRLGMLRSEFNWALDLPWWLMDRRLWSIRARAAGSWMKTKVS